MNIFLKHWFLVVLIFVLATGYGLSSRVDWLVDLKWLRYGIIASVLFVMAWPLETSAIGRVLRRPWGPVLASLINLGLVPIIAWPMSFLLGAELGPGLIVAATVPCTLATAAVWTRRAGGNDAVVMLVVVITNSLCFFVTPLWLLVLTGSRVDSALYTQLVGQLLLLVLIPMVAAQLSRAVGPVGQWATRQKRLLGVVAQMGVLSMVFIGAVHTGVRMSDSQTQLTLWALLLTLLTASVLHFSMLVLGVFVAARTGLPRTEQIAVGFAGSQKTMMVGLTTGLELGFNIIPMVIYHMVQLVGDTPIADRFRKSIQVEKHSETEQAADAY